MHTPFPGVSFVSHLSPVGGSGAEDSELLQGRGLSSPLINRPVTRGDESWKSESEGLQDAFTMMKNYL